MKSFFDFNRDFFRAAGFRAATAASSDRNEASGADNREEHAVVSSAAIGFIRNDCGASSESDAGDCFEAGVAELGAEERVVH